ncbi:hypothetical protein H1R13_19435 [Streptomyces mexicanus]|uniref:Uncharacterized protein n=1 Tax=Streptomyces mexicanus TaxID=178566 RepID=A0A7X1I1G4_9ACTN|nr:hypothetical protein [Streptomyces mexicanus]MBC2867060.1 hypothetical protein [Streptomyces mexicanus]
MTHTRPAVPTAVFTPPTAVGTAHALVFAPVTPHWDEGAFFAPVIRALNRAGLRVTVVDTLALCDGTTDSLARVTARWRALLPAFGPVDLLCGNALGGAVAQALLPYVDPATAVLLVSGPARTDAVLEQRLARIADLAAAGRTAEALALLHRRVLPADAPSPGPTATRTPPGPTRRRPAGWPGDCACCAGSTSPRPYGPIRAPCSRSSAAAPNWSPCGTPPPHRTTGCTSSPGPVCAPTPNSPQRCPRSSRHCCGRRD